jgi:hypothetical protein
MAKYSEQQSAARQFYADAPRPKSARDECEEGDDAEALAMESWAECMIRRGVDRRVALQCAADVWEVQRAKDEACARGMGQAGSAGRAPEELKEMLSRIGRDIVRAERSKYAAGCMLLAMGDKLFARSARDWAEKQGMSHESAANDIEKWQDLIGLPRTADQKSEAAIRSYRDTNGKKQQLAA